MSVACDESGKHTKLKSFARLHPVKLIWGATTTNLPWSRDYHADALSSTNRAVASPGKDSEQGVTDDAFSGDKRRLRRNKLTPRQSTGAVIT